MILRNMSPADILRDDTHKHHSIHLDAPYSFGFATAKNAQTGVGNLFRCTDYRLPIVVL